MELVAIELLDIVGLPTVHEDFASLKDALPVLTEHCFLVHLAPHRIPQILLYPQEFTYGFSHFAEELVLPPHLLQIGMYYLLSPCFLHFDNIASWMSNSLDTLQDLSNGGVVHYDLAFLPL